MSILCFMACEEEPPFVLAEGRCFSYSDIRGFAEINGENLWLSIGEVSVGFGSFCDDYRVNIGAYQPDCSLYEEFHVEINVENGASVDGTYEIQTDYSQVLPFAEATYSSREEDEFALNDIPIREGTVKITEISTLRFEVVFEAITIFNNPISFRYTNSPF